MSDTERERERERKERERECQINYIAKRLVHRCVEELLFASGRYTAVVC